MSGTPQFDFSSFIADHTKDFTGREWVFAEIDRWLADENGPSFFVIIGEPGVGKSAIAARLTQIKELAAYHFCIARRADTIDPTLFARSLSHQLCRIDGFALGILKDSNVDLKITQDVLTNYGQVIGARIENLVVNAPSGSVAFTHAVTEPLKALCDGGYENQVVLLVDALDEAVQYEGSVPSKSIVGLLADTGPLPRQVRLVLTSRPEGALRHFQERQIPHFPLDAGRPENLEDIRRYVRAQLEASAILRGQLADQPTPDAVFDEHITTASEGNFLYVVWLLREMVTGTRRFDALQELPQGLDGIYREFLRTRGVQRDKNKQDWRNLYRPILGALVAAQAPLSAPQVVQFTDLSSQDVDDGLEDLRQFLDPASANEGRYFLYHQSVNDWLQDKKRSQEFWVDVTPVHQRIVRYYQQDASSWKELNWGRVDDYGLRHLAMHLEGAGCAEDLHRLLCLGRLSGHRHESLWYSLKEDAGDVSGYLADVGRAWGQARKVEDVGKQVQCALYQASVQNIGYKIPAPLLDLCLTHKVLTWQQALSFARLRQAPLERAQTLSRLARSRFIPVETERRCALGQALESACAIESDQQRAMVLSELAPCLPEDLLNDAFEAAKKIECDQACAEVLSKLMLNPYVREYHLDDAWQAAATIADLNSSVRFIGALASRLPSELREEVLDGVLADVQKMDPGVVQVRALCDLAKYVKDNRRTEVLDLALAALLTTPLYSDERVLALSALAQHQLSDGQLASALEAARLTYPDEDDGGTREDYVHALAALGPLMSADQRAALVGGFVAMLRAHPSPQYEIFFEGDVSILAPYLPHDQQLDVFAGHLQPLVRQAAGPSFVGFVRAADYRCKAARAALEQLPTHLLNAALEEAKSIDSDDGRAEVLFLLVPRLQENRRIEVLEAELTRVRGIRDDIARAQLLAACVPHLPEGEQRGVAEKVIQASQVMPWNQDRFELVARVVEHLSNNREEQVLDEALAAVRNLEATRSQLEALVALKSCLSASSIPAALQIAESIRDAEPTSLATLAGWVSEDRRQDAIANFLEGARFLAGELPGDFVTALRELAPFMDESQISDSLRIAMQIGRADALVAVAPRLPEHLLTQAFAAAQDIRDDLSRVCALAALSPVLSDDQRSAALSEALKAAKALENDESHVRALVALIPHLVGGEREAAMKEALAAAKAIGEDDERAQAICDLLPCLADSLRREGFDLMLRSCLGLRVVETIGSRRIRQGLGRGFLLHRIAKTVGVVADMGGESAVGEIVCAVRDIGSWWP